MLVAIYLGIMSLLGGSGGVFGQLTTQHLEDQIEIYVAEERRSLALQSLAEVIDDIDEIDRQMAEDAEQIEELIRDYESTPDDFDRSFAAALDNRMEQLKKAVNHRQAMLRHITAEEWRTIVHQARLAAEEKSED
jgi:ubiquinone biosynthesis protein UbiJ